MWSSTPTPVVIDLITPSPTASAASSTATSPATGSLARAPPAAAPASVRAATPPALASTHTGVVPSSPTSPWRKPDASSQTLMIPDDDLPPLPIAFRPAPQTPVAATPASALALATPTSAPRHAAVDTDELQVARRFRNRLRQAMTRADSANNHVYDAIADALVYSHNGVTSEANRAAWPSVVPWQPPAPPTGRHTHALALVYALRRRRHVIDQERRRKTAS